MRIVIAEQFAGFPGIVQGGYLGGLLARELGGAVEVALRRPARTGVALDLARTDEGVTLRDGDTVVAQATSTHLALDVAPVDLATAEAAGGRYPGHHAHPFATCFCCGPARGEDGLRIFPGPLADRDVMATPWTPAAAFADAHGIVPPEILWAALDCPAMWSLCLQTVRGAPDKLVSGRIAVEQRGPVRVGEPYVIEAWPLGGEGRKLFCAAALLTAQGEPVAIARQTCVITDQGFPVGEFGTK